MLARILGSLSSPPPASADEIPLPRVNGQIASLYGQIWQADAEPTVAQSEAASAVEGHATELTERWNTLKTADLPTLNRVLHGANLPEVKVAANPHKDETRMHHESLSSPP